MFIRRVYQYAYHALRYNTIQHNTAQHNTTHYNIMQYNEIEGVRLEGPHCSLCFVNLVNAVTFLDFIHLSLSYFVLICTVTICMMSCYLLDLGQ